MLRFDPVRWRAPSELDPIRDEVAEQARARGAEFFDGECVRLAEPGRVQVCGYLDSLVTNRRANDPRVRPFGYDTDGELLGLRESRFANTLGAAVFVTDRTGAVLLQRQPADSMVSAGLWAPTGSGSSDPDDVRSSLAATLVETARRELAEESGLDLSPRLHSWRRNIDAGGKPEGMCSVVLDERVAPQAPDYAWVGADELAALDEASCSSPLRWWRDIVNQYACRLSP